MRSLSRPPSVNFDDFGAREGDFDEVVVRFEGCLAGTDNNDAARAVELVNRRGELEGEQDEAVRLDVELLAVVRYVGTVNYRGADERRGDLVACAFVLNLPAARVDDLGDVVLQSVGCDPFRVSDIESDGALDGFLDFLPFVFASF